MSEEITVIAEPREAGSSNESRRLRNAGKLPAVVNRDDGTATSIQLNMHDFEMMLKRFGDSAIVDLKVDKKDAKVLIKDVQVGAVYGELLHVDFVEVNMKRNIRVTVPIEIIGESVGVAQGGTLTKLIRDIEIECLPGNLPENLTIDVTDLKIEDSIYIKDIELGDDVTILTGGDVLIVAITAPRVSGKDTAADDAEAAEGGEGGEGADGDEASSDG